MSAKPARHLSLVDPETGELATEEHPEIRARDDVIRGLERALRKECREHEELKRDKDKEAREHRRWPQAVIVWNAWLRKTGRSDTWTDKPEDAEKGPDWPGTAGGRFWLVEPYLRKRKYGPEMCLRGVAGIAFDHYVSERKNGTRIRYNEWERLFKDSGQFERFCNAAPAGWRDDPVFVEAVERLRGLAK